MAQLDSFSLRLQLWEYRHRTAPNPVLHPLTHWKVTFGSEQLHTGEMKPELWLYLASSRDHIWKKEVCLGLLYVWCPVLFLLSVSFAFSESCQGTFLHCQGLGWVWVWQWDHVGAISKFLSSPSGLVLLVHKTQNAIIDRGFYCKCSESKEKRIDVNNKTLVTCVIASVPIQCIAKLFFLACNSV